MPPIKAGMEDVLPKPVSKDELFAATGREERERYLSRCEIADSPEAYGRYCPYGQ
jgi:hypothetical protein